MIHCHSPQWITRLYVCLCVSVCVCIRPCHTMSTIFNIRIHSCTDIITYLNKNEWIIAMKSVTLYGFDVFEFMPYSGCVAVCLSACLSIRHHNPCLSFFLLSRSHTHTLISRCSFARLITSLCYIHFVVAHLICAEFMQHTLIDLGQTLYTFRIHCLLYTQFNPYNNNNKCSTRYWIGTDVYTDRYTHTHTPKLQ